MGQTTVATGEPHENEFQPILGFSCLHEDYRLGLLREEAALYMTRCLPKQGLLIIQAVKMSDGRTNTNPTLAWNQQEILDQSLHLM